MDAALSLDRHGPLGRFDAPVEVAYRAWLIDQARPLIRALAYISIPAWIIQPFLFARQVDGLSELLPIVIVAWAINIPVLALALYNDRAWGWRVLEVATAALVMVAISNVTAVSIALPDTEAGTYAAGAIFYGMLGPFMRLPVVHTVVASLLITSIAMILAAERAPGPADRILDGPNGTLPIITLFMVPTFAGIIERSLRDRYVDEQTIAHQRQLIRRYAPSSVVSHIEQGDTGVDSPQRRKVTVFFSDVVGFTTMADRVDPEALAEIVNDYLGNLADLIERHGGTLNEFAGDGVMAIFGAPDELDPAEQVRSAIAAARELQARLPQWSQGWYQHGILEDAQARVGINTGTISVGTFGSTVRATYTGIGLQTNIAARVQAEAKPGGILLSNTSWHLVKDTVACESRGEVMVKGVHFPIELYEPVTT